MKCPKCGYERQASDVAPDWQCPSCKVAYIKVLQALEREKAASALAAKESVSTLKPTSLDLPPAMPTPVQVTTEKVTKEKVATEQDQADDDEESESDEHHWEAAQGQKMLIYSIICNFVLNSAQQSQVLSGGFLTFLFFCVSAYSILGILKICTSFDKNQNQKILYMVMCFFPLINLILMVYLSIKTSKMLREAGWTVGLLGAKP